MKKLILTVISATFFLSLDAQTTRFSLGTSGSVEVFHDSKIDTTEGSSIHVGSKTNPGSGRDLFMIKLTSTQQIAWQKTIVNSGEDAFFKVIVCSNGDYVAVGQMFEGGIQRAVAYRISSIGDIIWSYRSANSALGELFWDVIETTGGNIAIVGADSYETSQTNSFIVLLNSAGSNLWSRVSNTPLADEFRSIIQLPNGNLLAVGFYNPSSNYVATILELTESNAGILSQNTYTMNASVPGGQLNNSLWSTGIFVRNNNVLIQFSAFQNFGSFANQSIYNYDLTTKDLTGNFYFNTAASSAKGYSFYAQVLGEAAVDLPANYFDTTKAAYRLRRDTIVKRLNEMPGVFCPNPGGAFYAMASLPIDDCDKFCQWLLQDFSHEGATVMLAPATGFYSTPGLGKNEVRLAYVLNVDAINKAMDCLEQALQVYPGRI